MKGAGSIVGEVNLRESRAKRGWYEGDLDGAASIRGKRSWAIVHLSEVRGVFTTDRHRRQGHVRSTNVSQDQESRCAGRADRLLVERVTGTRQAGDWSGR